MPTGRAARTPASTRGSATPTTPTARYGQLEFCDVPTLGRNRVVLGQLVGASNYDVGHIGLGVNGGGVAYLGVVGADYKGGGCTGLPEPKGDFFAIDYVAHEFGHQYAGNHTFNGVQWNCGGGNRKPSTSVEPGSGSSVMAYAGICRQDDLQPHTDPYFSAKTHRRGQRLHQQPDAAGGRGADGVADRLRCRRHPRRSTSGSSSVDITVRRLRRRRNWRPPIEALDRRGRHHRRVGLRPVLRLPVLGTRWSPTRPASR